MSRSASLLAVLLIAGLSGCGAISSRLDGNIPRAGSIVPNSTIQLTNSFAIPLEKLVFWGAYAGAAYLILDPRSPNWEIEEAPMPDNHIHLAMKMKRYYAGGAGEARLVFQRRARDLVQYGGFDGYEVIEYGEGIESSVLGSQRVTEGVIRLIGKGNQDQGSPAPARMTPDKATNPLS